jgi:hypothetical protein
VTRTVQGVGSSDSARLRIHRFPRGLDPLTVIAAIVVALGVVGLFAGALKVAVTTDEPTEAEQAQSWIDYGWYLPPRFMAEGRPDPANDYSSPYVYGPAYEATAHAANVVLRKESIGEIGSSAGVYKVRHLVVALLAALTAVAVAAGVWCLTRSRRFALWAAAGLLVLPRWTGHGFFNPKDVPVASGYTFLTVGLLLALQVDGRPTPHPRWAIGALLAGGFFIAAGTRLSMLVPFLFTLALYAALRVGQRRWGGVAADWRSDGSVTAGALAGLVAIAVTYPKVAATPLKALVDSVSSAAGYPYTGYTLTAGSLLSEHPPWYYLPIWIGASMPLLLGGLALFGAACAVWALSATVRRGGRGPAWASADLGLALVLAQLLLAPIGAVLAGTVLYSGMRHVLFVLPALAILAAVGAQRLWSWSASRVPQRRWRGVATAVLSLALIAPLVEGAVLFPYDYTYVNPIAAIGGVNDTWETEYWWASGREALSRVPRGARLLCSPFLVTPWDEDGRPDLEPCDDSQLTPFAADRGTDVAKQWQGDTEATWVIARKRAGNRPPAYCEEADDVTRWLWGEEVTMSYVLRCDPAEAQRDVIR